MPTRRLSGTATAASDPDNGGDHSGGGGSAGVYVDDVFSTYLYTGTGNTQTITNGVDLDGEGGMVWIKRRDYASNHNLYDTERGPDKKLSSNLEDPESVATHGLSFDSNGFSLNTQDAEVNRAGNDYASWTFRKAPNFFDVVTYTGDGADMRDLTHNLVSKPGVVLIKCIDQGPSFWNYYTNFTDTKFDVGNFNNSNPFNVDIGYGSALYARPDEDKLYLGKSASVNGLNRDYVAYLFAHDDSDESMIKCGSYTGNGNIDGPEIDLGFEPQWLLIKESSASGNAWSVYDMMRDGTMGQHLRPNSSDPENIGNSEVLSQATGFKLNTSSGRVNRSEDYIYIAIRRPNKPASEFAATDLFAVDQTSHTTSRNVGFVPDTAYFTLTSNSTGWITSRLQGQKALRTTGTNIESNGPMNWDDPTNYWSQGLDSANLNYFWRRAPGFFDVVAYEGDSQLFKDYSHNLGVVPELIILKCRNSDPEDAAFQSNFPADWFTAVKDPSKGDEYGGHRGALNLSDELTYVKSNWNGHTDTTFRPSLVTAKSGVGGGIGYFPGNDYVAYLFATVPGISKVGSYTGTGIDQEIDCGFTTGARFVLIKSADAAGDWMVFDALRGITSGSSPMLTLNTASSELSGSFIKPSDKGFTVTNNFTGRNGTEYIYMAIA